jgi:cytochrome c-type biogenesis protein CcmH
VSWVQAIALAVIAFAVLAFVLRAPRSGWEAIGAALLFGIAGYGLQAKPGLDGAPKDAAQQVSGDPAALVKARSVVTESGIPPRNKWIVIADGLSRNGQHADAAEVLLGAIDEDRANGEAWLALGNALVSHADGLLTPAALHAYQKAADAEPDHPGPPFFLGLALAQTGRFAEARSLWGELLKRTPDNAPWRENLTMQIERLDALIAQQQGTPTAR